MLPPTFKVKQNWDEEQEGRKNKVTGLDENKKTKKQKENQANYNTMGNRIVNNIDQTRSKWKQ